MSDFVIGQIRTYTPIAAGAVIGWLIAQGILSEDAAAEAQNALVILITVVTQGVYYFVVRLLADWKPIFGNLLGVNQKPNYVEGRS